MHPDQLKELVEITDAVALLPLGRSLSIMKALAPSLRGRSERLLGQFSIDRRRIDNPGLASNSGEIRWEKEAGDCDCCDCGDGVCCNCFEDGGKGSSGCCADNAKNGSCSYCCCDIQI